MNSYLRATTRALLVGVVSVLLVAAVWAQQEVAVDINLPNYDVLYVTDMFDVTTGSISSAIPDISISLTNTTSGPLRAWMRLVARVHLQGEGAPQELVVARSLVFGLDGTLVISARDFAEGRTASVVRVEPSDVLRPGRNSGLETRLRDHILKFPTAPVGNYTVEIAVFEGGETDRDRPENNRLGGGSKTVSVRNSSAGDVTISLLEPQDGASVASLLPTFSWSSDKQRNRLQVFEKLPHHQSPQEAVTGIPHLSAEVNGTVFTYPPNARKLDVGKTYYWFVESLVSTNRGDETRRSEIRTFRIQSSNMTALSLLLEQLFSTYGADLAPVLVSMQSMGLQLSGDITLDGGRVTRDDLARLFDGFVQNQTKLSVRIE